MYNNNQLSFYFYKTDEEPVPTFEVGDEVEFEESGEYPDLPRWILDKDYGASGRWIRAKVKIVNNIDITVEYNIPDNRQATHLFIPLHQSSQIRSLSVET